MGFAAPPAPRKFISGGRGDANNMRAIDCLRAGVRQAIRGEETIVELREPAPEALGQLVDEGLEAIPLLVRGGLHPRILVLPRRKSGVLTLTEVLGVDHARLDALLDRVHEQATAHDVSVARTAFDFAWSMRRHMWIEDHILYPLYERSSGVPLQKHVQPFRVEHACIEHYTALLLRASEKIGNPETRHAGLSDFLHVHCGLVGVLEEHDLKEEKSLFPTIDHTVSFLKEPSVLRSVIAFDPDMTSIMAGRGAERRH